MFIVTRDSTCKTDPAARSDLASGASGGGDRVPGSVLLFTNGVDMGGMEEHVLLLAAGLVERGIRTGVACSAHPRIRPLREAAAQSGAAVHTFATERAQGRSTASRFVDLVRLFRSYRQGVLHIHSTGFHGGDLLMLAGRAAGMAAILRTEHMPPQPPLGLRQRLQVRARDRYLLDRGICVSTSTKNEHLAVLGRDSRKLVVVPNGIRLDRFVREDGAGLRAEIGIPSGAPLIGTIARLAEERKGISQFLLMAAAVGQERRDARFVIVGDGPLRRLLEQQASELGIGERVLFVGERRDVPRVIAALDIFVMPSLHEAGPLTLLEAMAMGKPVVTTAVGVVDDVVEHGLNGLVVPPGDARALTECVQRILSDPALGTRLGRAALQTAWPGFSVEKMVDDVLDQYVLGGRSGPSTHSSRGTVT